MPSHFAVRNSMPAHTMPTHANLKVTLNHDSGSSDSFTSLPSAELSNSNWESSSGLDEDNEVAACIAVLDRAIAWAKARSQKQATQPSRPAKGSVAPIGSPVAGAPEVQGSLFKPEDTNVKKLTECVTVIDKTMSAVKRRPSTTIRS